MILYNKKIIISPITTHIKVKNISKIISNKRFLYNQIKNLNNTLKIDFNITKPTLYKFFFGYMFSKMVKLVQQKLKSASNC